MNSLMKYPANTKLPLISMFMIIVAVVGLVINILVDNDRAAVPELIKAVNVSPHKDIHIEGLIRHNNTLMSQSDLKNKWTFLFFGYTNCPDVCPATLTQLVLMKKSISQWSNKPINSQYLFISVDPERDTVPRLAEYIQYFDNNFIAATGSQSKLKQVEKQFQVFHRYGKKDSNGLYTVQHSAEIYLINPRGQLTAKFTPPMDIPLAVKQIAMILERYRNATV
jgi:protein SCO1/2